MQRFEEIAREFEGRITCVSVYIAEAHPSDGWSLPQASKYNVRSATTLDERINTCKTWLLEIPEVHSTYVVDAMNDNANAAFNALPERLYVIENSTVQYVGGLGPFNYDIDSMSQYLSTRLSEGPQVRTNNLSETPTN